VKVRAYRIFKPKHQASAFTGDGARLFGGRWNSKGTAVVYTASSCALAALEMLVHLQSQQLLEAYLVSEVTFDSELVRPIDRAVLPASWREDPVPAELKALGDQWAAAASSAVLQVPSAIIETESNYLLNPAHADFRKILRGAGRKFVFDPRLAR